MNNEGIYLKSNKECQGCGACKNICPIDCIDMKEDEEGFIYPVINEKKCIQCGKCIETCQYPVETFGDSIISKAFAAYSQDESIRKASSSGGIFSEIAHLFFAKNGYVYGATWVKNYEAVQHICVKSENDIGLLQGSKYIQSNTLDTFKQVQKDLDDEIPVLFSGTPCQIAGLNKYLKKSYENLVTCAVICHGVSSTMVWRKHLHYLEGRKDGKVSDISFRNKSQEGWKNYQIKYKFGDREEYFRQEEDIFFRCYLENLILRPSCYECEGEWKHCIADIVLGDFWGIENVISNINYYEGVSAVLVNSQKGERLINQMKKNCFFEMVSFEDIYQSNTCCINAVKKSDNRNQFFVELKLTGDVESSLQNNMKNYLNKEKRQNALYPVLYRYLDCLLDGKGILDFIKKISATKILLYASSQLMKLFLKELNNNKEIDIYVSDKNYKHLRKEMAEYNCVLPSKISAMVNDNVIDCIIVCSMFYENEIINQLIDDGIEINKIYSAVEIISNLKYL